MKGDVARYRAALQQIVEVGTHRSVVRVGDMYDPDGYDEVETISEEAEIAAAVLRTRAPTGDNDGEG